MKKMGLLLVLLAMAGRVGAQFLGGIFSQSATELKDYGEQVAALQLLIGSTEKGYGIVGNGLSVIGEINGGEYGLHSTYFASLAAVNPAVAGMPEISEILDLEGAIVSGFSAALARWRSGGVLTAWELDYVGQVEANLFGLGSQELGQLGDLLAPGRLTMTDGARMGRVRELDILVRDQYAFVQVFAVRVDGLVGERVGEGQ